MNKHTPGPWFTSRPHQTIYIEARIGGGMLQEVGAIGPTEGGPRQQEANARLIAAAPELLEALQGLLAGEEIATSLEDYAAASEKARAAISKATGEPS